MRPCSNSAERTEWFLYVYFLPIKYMNREEKIARIYKIIAQREQITEEIIRYMPVIIGDVLKYWLANCLYNEKKNINWWNRNALTICLVDRRLKLNEPIDNQPDECVDFVYSLLPTKDTHD